MRQKQTVFLILFLVSPIESLKYGQLFHAFRYLQYFDCGRPNFRFEKYLNFIIFGNILMRTFD